MDLDANPSNLDANPSHTGVEASSSSLLSEYMNARNLGRKLVQSGFRRDLRKIGSEVWISGNPELRDLTGLEVCVRRCHCTVLYDGVPSLDSLLQRNLVQVVVEPVFLLEHL